MQVHPDAPSRLAGAPVAIVDIGSNSVRLVAYEMLARALTPIFNEKVLCGLGRGVATTGLLAEEAMNKAVAALGNFRLLCRQMGIADITVLATAATRDARNGGAFLERARAAIGAEITLVAGPREAELSALGVISGTYHADGLVGDLGGGSLELIDLRGQAMGAGVSLPIGGLALSDLSRESPRRAVRIVREALATAPLLAGLRDRTFYAVGGTWRALAKLHMSRREYPLRVVQGYSLPADPALFAEVIGVADAAALADVASARRPLLAYGAVVLEEIVRLGQPREVVISTCGVREGMLFERLSPAARAADPLLEAAEAFNHLRSRSPAHGAELRAWTDGLVQALGLAETPAERRLRHAACLLADVAWRAHPDDRGRQASADIANAALVGVSHAERCALALALLLRYEGVEAVVPADIKGLVTPGMVDRARLMAAALRIAFQLSAAMPGVLPRMAWLATRHALVLRVPEPMADLVSLRVQNRVKQLAKLAGREPEIVTGP